MAIEYRRLEFEAGIALLAEGNTTKWKSILQERANLVIELPKKIGPITKDKGIMLELGQLSALAKDHSKTDVGLNIMLTPWGSRTGDPNILEELIQKIEKE